MKAIRRDIIIPTVIIGKSDGEIIKDYWRECVKNSVIPEIIISIKYEMKQVDGKEPEKMELYFNSIEERMYRFLIYFRPFYMEISN